MTISKTMGKMRKGATFIEYALLAGLVAIVIAAGAVLFGDKIKALFENTGKQTDKIGAAVEKADLVGDRLNTTGGSGNPSGGQN